jgi:hypothetical protein
LALFTIASPTSSRFFTRSLNVTSTPMVTRYSFALGAVREPEHAVLVGRDLAAQHGVRALLVHDLEVIVADEAEDHGVR